MARETEPRVLQLANALQNPVDIDAYLRFFWRIVPDPIGFEFVRAPELQLQIADRSGGILRGDCDDAATLAASLLYALQWPCYVVALRPPGSSEFAHVFCRVPLNGGVNLDIDPIMPEGELPIRGFAEMMIEPV